MAQNVKFYFTSMLEKYLQLPEKNPLALYFVTDEATGQNYLYKGDKLLAAGHEATSKVAGLMSAEDKAKLDALIAGEGHGISELIPIDSSVVITDTADGGKAIGVAISSQEGNALRAVEGGLFVPVAEDVVVPEYKIEKQEVAEDGYAVSYKLKKIVDGESSYVGDVINIGKDMVLQSAVLAVVTEANVPYAGAAIGDPYIDMAFNDVEASHIYVPVKGLVDTYVAGVGIEIVDNKISVKIAADSHGLTAVDGAMSMLLASAEQDGAMSKEDKVFIDSIPNNYATIQRVKKTATCVKYEIAARPQGAIVDYRDKEIRVMCPVGTKWVKQNVGSTGNANMYYMGFKAYAPDGAVSFKEDDQATIEDQTMYYFENNDFAGVDEFGRKYSIVWLALASYDEASDAWSYFGEKSSAGKYIGWYYTVEWYDANGVMIDADQIRINLTNEDCHNIAIPYYMSNYATIEQMSAIEETVGTMSESYTWGEL